MIKNQEIYFEDILFSIESIEKFTKGLSKEGFGSDQLIQDAVIRRFSVIGEAANRIRKEVQDSHKNIEWRKIVNMRNFLLHEYSEINLDVVWDSIKTDLPGLKKAVREILDASKDNSSDR